MWPMLIAAGATLLSGAMGADAAGEAADAQRDASQNAIAEQRRQYNLTRSDTAPYRAAGSAALTRLEKLLGTGGSPYVEGTATETRAYRAPTYDDILNYNINRGGTSDDAGQQWAQVQSGAYGSNEDVYKRYKAGGYEFENPYTSTYSGGTPDSTYGALTRDFTTEDLNSDPVYNSGLQFGLDQGRDAINARAIATGGYDSGATLKALTRFGNDYGSTKAGESYNRFQNSRGNIFNMLSGVSGTGQSAVGQVGSAGMNAANNVSNLQTGIGNANAASVVGGANAWGGAINNGINGYQNNMILQKLLEDRSGRNMPYVPGGSMTDELFGNGP